MILEYEILDSTDSDYSRAKRMLDRGRHPTFIGRDQFKSAARNGGVIIARVGDEDAAVAMTNPRLNSLNVLNVLPQYRKQGVGAVFVEYLKCNWARVVENAVPWFEKQGYQKIGAMKQGRRLRTQIMAYRLLFELGARLRRLTTHQNGESHLEVPMADTRRRAGRGTGSAGPASEVPPAASPAAPRTTDRTDHQGRRRSRP
jgi:GNAT superfamily N-acetyltransferase